MPFHRNSSNAIGRHSGRYQLPKGVALRNGLTRQLSGARETIISAVLNNIRANDEMSIDDFEYWFTAIERDDYEFIRHILQQCSIEERQILVNGRFVYDPQPADKKQLGKLRLPCAYQRPLFLAAVFRSIGAMQVLLHHGGDLFLLDIKDNCIIHALIWGASLKPRFSDEYVTMYDHIMRELSSSNRKELLFVEDDLGLRPLELAARLCTFNLFQRILDTDGVYLCNRGRMGAHNCTWFDVTDYDSWDTGQRMDRSPLKMLTCIEKEHLQNAHQAKLMTHPAVARWIEAKISHNIPYLVLWSMVRIMYTVLIFVCATSHIVPKQSNSEENTTYRIPTTMASTEFDFTATADVSSATTTISNGTWTIPKPEAPCPKPLFPISNDIFDILVYVLMAYSSAIVASDVFEFLLYYLYQRPHEKRCHHPFGSRNYVVRTRFYRVSNFLLGASVLIFHITRIVGKNWVTSKAYMLANILSIWSLLFFIQLLPAMGYFVTIITRMLKDMFHFLVLYLLLFFAFSQTFYNLFYMVGNCNDEFSTVPWSMYSTFRVMLNMIDLTQYEGMDVTDLAILHITFVIVVPILLVNFLIALMSNSVSDVAENRYLIMTLQRLSASLLVEHRIGRILKPIYKLQQRRRLIQDNEGHIYVECFVLNES